MLYCYLFCSAELSDTKRSKNVEDSDVIAFSAPERKDHKIIGSDDANNDMAYDYYLPETVVLNRDSIVEHRYAMFHHDDEDVLTDKQFFENNADKEKTMK